MKIMLNQPVHSTGGLFGDLADVVVDPSTNTVTHIIVAPHRRHYQARLVPTSLIDFEDGLVKVKLDEAHLRSLQRVAESEFVPLYQPIDLGEEWDVGIEHIVTLPYEAHDFDTLRGGGLGEEWDDRVTINFDRIPKGECEIRHESHVLTSDDHQVGLVSGMIVDSDHIEGFYVDTGLPGFRHIVAVPIMAVSKVRNDEVTLNMDRKTFRRLSPVEAPAVSVRSKLDAAEHRVASAGKQVIGAVRSKLHRS